MRIRSLLLYGSMLTGVVLAFLLLRCYGEKLVAPSPLAGMPNFGSASSNTHVNDLLHVLLAMVVVIATARVVGRCFQIVHQTPVIGEIIAGILLGPSLLGYMAPAASSYLFPRTVAPLLNIISQVGVILYMFLVGLELDPSLLRKRGHATIAISHARILVPFLLGATLALALYSRVSSSDVPFTDFALFLGVSMSVTAFPVLARILTDQRIHKTRIGAMALTCAAVDDITAWCLLAFVVSVARAETAASIRIFWLALTYIATMIFLVRPAMNRLSRMYGNRGRLTQGIMTIIFAALLLSAAATELVGIHAVFGAFALGVVMPHDTGMARDLSERLEDVVVVLLLPVFFAFTGLRTQIGLVNGGEQWLICALIIAVASIGKFSGTLAAARITGLGWREGSALGVLMNTRGLMELIVLNIGFEMRVISPTLFTMLVLMAVVTTLATTPILHLIMRREPIMAEGMTAAAGAGPTREERSAILVPVSNPQSVAALVGLALALVRRPVEGMMSGLREVEQPVPSRSPALAAALDFALEHGALITPQAVWSDDPASDILRVASLPPIRWLLLGSHRAVFGSDFKGGVVREILDKARALPVNVGVVIASELRRHQHVLAIVDATHDGRAALELAARVALQEDCELYAMLVPGSPNEADPGLTRILSKTARIIGRRLHTEVLVGASAAQLRRQTPDGLMIIGSSLAERFGLSHDGFAVGRSLVVVQGSEFAPPEHEAVSGGSRWASL